MPVPAPTVARRADHSVDVLLRVHANCIDGDDGIASQHPDYLRRPLLRHWAGKFEHARKRGRGGPAQRASRTAAGRQRSAEVRAWAKDQGISVSARGRIPASVMEQYQAAKGS
jgi:hypothetical protein